MCIKVDTAGAPLPGVEFNLYNASTMEKVETVVSDKNGVFTFSRFEYGDWIIRKRRPRWYCRMEGHACTLVMTGRNPSPSCA